VQQGGQQTIQHSLHGDIGAALKQVPEMLQAIVTALIDVLRRHLQTILRLALALALLAFEHTLEQPAPAQ
jgi:hypothetical protein